MIAWPNPPKTSQKAIDLTIWLEQVKPFCKLQTATTQQSNALTRSVNVDADMVTIFIDRQETI